MTATTRTLRAERPVADFVPFSHHVTRSIVATRSYEYVSVWKIGGRTFEGYSVPELGRWVEELNNIIKGFPAGFGLWSHLVRREVSEYPRSDYPDVFSRQHDDAYRRNFEGKRPMINELYLTTIMRATVDPALRTLSRLETRSAKDLQAWQDRAIEQLEGINDRLSAGLRRYSPELLEAVERGPGLHFSEPAEFFGFLLNGRMEPVPLTDARLFNYLPSARPFFSRFGEQGKLRGPNWERQFAMLEIREYDRTTRPGHLNSLLRTPCEMVLTQSFGAMTKSAGLDAMKRQKKWLEDSKDYSQSQIRELGNALDGLAAGDFIMGDHHATVTVYGESSKDTLNHAAEVIGDLAGDGIVARLVDKALVAAWMAQLPCNWRWRPRPAPITSLNFLCFSSLHNYLFGKPNGNPWGPAVTVLKTRGGTPYYLNFHATVLNENSTGKRRLGNTGLLGKSGTGKTVALGHLLTQARKLDYTGVIFDKDCGLSVTVKALGGKYFRLQLGVRTGWNPFQLPVTEGNVAMMRRLAIQMASDGHAPPTAAEQRDIAQALHKLTKFIDQKDRRLSTLLQFLPAAPRLDGTLSVRERLERWCEGHEYGWLFDNPQDELDMSRHDLFGFDLTEFLDHGPVRDAALTYLTYRTEQMSDGRRFAWVLDEVQHPLKVPFIQEILQDRLRTARKENAVIIYATQEPDAIVLNPIGKTLVQQSATVLYLPNDKATAGDYIDGFKLTPSEFRMVNELGEFSRECVVKQGESTVTAKLDLSQCPDSLLVFSGSADMDDLAEKAIAEHGNDPERWLPHYLALARAATSNQ